jgi:hypothetical protein
MLAMEHSVIPASENQEQDAGISFQPTGFFDCSYRQPGQAGDEANKTPVIF